MHQALYVDGKLEYDDESISGEQWESVIQRFKIFSGVDSHFLTSAYIDDKGYNYQYNFHDYLDKDLESN